MSKTVEVLLPDIGNFNHVDVIEVLVTPGDSVRKEDPLIILESEKATMEVPSPHAGVVQKVRVKVGDKVSKGSPILTLILEEVLAGPVFQSEPALPPVKPSLLEPIAATPPADPLRPAPTPISTTVADIQAQVLVLGAGPGGYTAAFRAADLGLQVVLIERYPTLGGVCLNVGCIPSKTLLHVAKVIDEAATLTAHGVTFGPPTLDLARLRTWKESVVGKLTKGLAGLAKQRKVQVIQGIGRFTGPHRLEVDGTSGRLSIAFQHAIIAAGSASIRLPGIPYDDPRIIDSTGALALLDIPAKLLIIGGGIIGLEMATVYAALGSRVTIVELTPTLIPGCDPDLVRPLQRRIESRFAAIHLNTKITRIETNPSGLIAHLHGPKGTFSDCFDRILVATGRRPNGASLGAEAAGVRIDDRGFIPVDRQQRTNVPHLYAIGDVVGNPMLAHKASHEGRVAAEVIAGHKSVFDAQVIPNVAYTDPEIAWVGLTETEAKQKGIPYEKGSFPWAASGRSLSLGREEGLTKLLFDPTTERLLGAGMVGPGAGELVAEAALAIEMGADARDIALTIHPHPSLSETVAFSAEAFEGTLTDLYLPKKPKKQNATTK
ncbi:dihydrolipoamide dehydrogenase [Gammaproteobacteria bacterium]